jgi:predicted RNA-binding protein YlqC (UPF0109 family)
VRTSTSRSVLANAKAQLLMALQDEEVGAVLGKKGQTLTQIQQVSECASDGVSLQGACVCVCVCRGGAVLWGGLAHAWLLLVTRARSGMHALARCSANATTLPPLAQQNAKVAIKISDRNKMDPHTHEREVSITGAAWLATCVRLQPGVRACVRPRRVPRACRCLRPSTHTRTHTHTSHG